MVESKINIAIDGPSGSGKGVTAMGLAKKLNYNYLDTGAMYRAIALYMKRNNISINNFKKEILNKIELNFNKDNLIMLNNEIVEEEIRTDEISILASDFSKIPEIRKFLVNKQKEISASKGYIVEGRDIGSVVMPDAELKIFLTADIDIRAKRRYLDYIKKGKKITLEEVKESLIKRDKQDTTRKISPLIKTKDAIEIDTSNISIEEQIQKIFELTKKINSNNY